MAELIILIVVIAFIAFLGGVLTVLIKDLFSLESLHARLISALICALLTLAVIPQILGV